VADLDQRLRDHLLQLRDSQTEDLGADLMAWLDRDDAARTPDLPPDLVVALSTDREQLGRRIVAQLAGWLRLGGDVRLDVAGAPAAQELSAAGPEVDLAPAPLSVVAQDAEEETEELELEPVVVALEAVVAPEVVVSQAPPRPAHTASLTKLKDRFEGGASLLVDPPQDAWRDLVDPFLKVLGGDHEHHAELDRLASHLQRKLDQLCGAPADIQCQILGLATARLRRLQECLPGEERRIVALIRQLSGYSGSVRPGYVYGLALEHTPRHGTWADDADHLLAELEGEDPAPPVNAERVLSELQELVAEIRANVDAPGRRDAAVATLRRVLIRGLQQGLRPRDPRLVQLLGPYVADLDHATLRPVRRAIRVAECQVQVADDDDSGSFLAPDWPWWSYTRGRRAVIIGGDPRELNRQRIQAAFEFSELGWIETKVHNAGRLRGLVERVRTGGVDVILMLTRFSSHLSDHMLVGPCKEHGVDLVHVHGGYGVTGVRLAIERFLGPSQGASVH
jgi:hypothetical protein